MLGERRINNWSQYRLINTFRSRCKKLDDQARSNRPEIVDSLVILKAIAMCSYGVVAKMLYCSLEVNEFESQSHSRMTGLVLYFDLRPGPKILFHGNTPEESDTFQRPVIKRDRVGGLRLMIWDKVKVPLCHYSHAPEESNLWTAWQLFPLDDD